MSLIIKWPLGLLADIILYNSEVIQYLHRAVNIVAKISATPLKTYVKEVFNLYNYSIGNIVLVPTKDVLGNLITTLKIFFRSLF